MRVLIDVGDSTAELGNQGMILHVFDGTKKVGRLRIGRATVEWFPGKTSKNSKKVRLVKLLEFLEERG